MYFGGDEEEELIDEIDHSGSQLTLAHAIAAICPINIDKYSIKLNAIEGENQKYKLTFRMDATEDCVFRVMIKQPVDGESAQQRYKNEQEVLEQSETSAAHRSPEYFVSAGLGQLIEVAEPLDLSALVDDASVLNVHRNRPANRTTDLATVGAATANNDNDVSNDNTNNVIDNDNDNTNNNDNVINNDNDDDSDDVSVMQVPGLPPMPSDISAVERNDEAMPAQNRNRSRGCIVFVVILLLLLLLLLFSNSVVSNRYSRDGTISSRWSFEN